MVEVADTIKRHWRGILNSIRTHATNAVLEGVNGLVQAGKARAHGYRNVHRFISMIYVLAGKLDFKLPAWGGAPAFGHTK
jgi:transposase